MPVRFLRPGIRQSRRFNRVGYFEQSLYIRLLTMVDDFARYEADPELVRSEAFPYGDPAGNVVQVTAVDSGLRALAGMDMLKLYEVNGVKYLQLTRWQERVRAAKSRYPDFCQQMPADASKCQLPTPSPSPSPSPVRPSMPPVEEPANSRPLPHPLAEEGSGRTFPTIQMAEGWLAQWKKHGAHYTFEQMKSAFLACSANGWMWGNNPVTDFRAALERQIQRDLQYAESRTKTNRVPERREHPRNVGVIVGPSDYTRKPRLQRQREAEAAALAAGKSPAEAKLAGEVAANAGLPPADSEPH